MVQTEEERKHMNLMDYYFSSQRCIKSRHNNSQSIVGDVQIVKLRGSLGGRKTSRLMLHQSGLAVFTFGNSHDDLQLRRVALDPLVKEIVKKHAFFIQKGVD